MIAITYSCIAPLVLGFATVGLYLIYFAYRYNLLFVNTTTVDTKGLVYPRALQHMTVGCYLLILCLLGLFGIQAAPGPLVMMVVLLIVSVLYHVSLNNAIQPLLYYIPRSLEAEEETLLQAEEGVMHSSGARNGDSFEKPGANGSRAIGTDKGLAPPPPPQQTHQGCKILPPDQ